MPNEVQVYANYDEEFPVYYLTEDPRPGTVNVMLTEPEWEHYQRVRSEYAEWQACIRERAFSKGL